jgi:hypothetical protein
MFAAKSAQLYEIEGKKKMLDGGKNKEGWKKVSNLDNKEPIDSTM